MNIRQFRSLAEQIADVREEADIEARVSSEAMSHGYGNYLVGYINPAQSEKPWLLLNYHNLSDDLPDDAERDPLLKLVRAKPETVAWGPELYHGTGNSDIWENGYALGIHSGISCPIRPGGTRRMQVAFMRGAEFDGSPEHLQEHKHDLERLTHLLAGTVMWLNDTRKEAESTLLKIEIEALSWTFDGYSPADISEMLNVGFNMAQRILKSASSKLGLSCEIEASMLLARLGMIRH